MLHCARYCCILFLIVNATAVYYLCGNVVQYFQEKNSHLKALDYHLVIICFKSKLSECHIAFIYIMFWASTY